jgi:hypothetical protein
MALCAAEDALSRLDAAALAAPDAVREGLAARLAFREAAGWLAHADAWVHPLDLALRDLGLTGSYLAAASAGRTRRELPITMRSSDTRGWDPADPDSLPEDVLVATALALARALRRLATTSTWTPLGSLEAAQKAFGPLGLGGLDPAHFTPWRAGWKAQMETRPALLAALGAAGWWPRAETGEAERPRWSSSSAGNGAEEALRASFAAAAVVTASRRLRAIPLPCWASVPSLPASRWRDRPGWGTDPAVITPTLRLITEAARAGAMELDRLLSAAEAGARLAAGVDPRSRLPAAVDAALRVPALTPTALARRLKVVPQTATDLCRQLAVGKVVREATGRKSFRAFVI